VLTALECRAQSAWGMSSRSHGRMGRNTKDVTSQTGTAFPRQARGASTSVGGAANPSDYADDAGGARPTRTRRITRSVSAV
jgi:hypothetical protein